MSNCPQFPGDQSNGHKFPDIGPDPMKLSTRSPDRSEPASVERLKRARDVQQMYVPDQTALVWRIDLMRLFDRMDLAEGRLAHTQRMVENLREEIERLKEPVICAITVARDIEAQTLKETDQR